MNAVQLAKIIANDWTSRGLPTKALCVTPYHNEWELFEFSVGSTYDATVIITSISFHPPDGKFDLYGGDDMAPRSPMVSLQDPELFDKLYTHIQSTYASQLQLKLLENKWLREKISDNRKL